VKIDCNCLAIDKTGAEKNHELEFEPPRPQRPRRGLWEALSGLDVIQIAFTFATNASIDDLFERLKRQGPIELEPLVFQDPIFQRIMVSIVVNPKKVAGAHEENAKVFEKFLIEPAIQARIRAFRYPDFDSQPWWPAGRHNMAKE
jgi:hypothetical protein